MKRICLTVMAAITAFALILFYKQSLDEPIALSVAEVEMTNVSRFVNCKGKIEEGEKCDVYSEGPAVVDRVYVSVGDEVVRGTALFSVTELTYGVDIDAESVKREIADAIGIDSEWFDSILADVDTANISATPAKNARRYTVKSPISGVVTKLEMQAGTVLSGAVSRLTVSDLTSIRVTASVGEAVSSEISIGQSVVFTGDAFENGFTGFVDEISPVVRTSLSLTGGTSTSVDIGFRVPVTPENVKPGSTVNAKIYTEIHENSLIVPYRAVCQDDDGREYVFIFSGGTIEKRAVVTDIELEDSIEVIYGLSEGETVVLSPGNELRSGQKAVRA